MMTERYSRHSARSRSPPIYNSSRINLPINLSGNPTTEVHLHTIPTSRRESSSNPTRNPTTSTVSSAGTVTTTYKIKAETSRSSDVRGNSRARRSTLDSNSRPIVNVIPTTITVTPRHVHASSAVRSESLHRSSEEEYVVVPLSSRQGSQHHRERHPVNVDNGDIISVESEREGSRIRIGALRDAVYAGVRTRPTFAKGAVRHPEKNADDYEEDGYGYTKPGDLVEYDLHHNPQPHRFRRNSFDTEKKQRPNSISSFTELVSPKYYDPRERRPPPSTRGFDRIRAENWDQTQTRSTVPSPGFNSPVDPVPRFASADSVDLTSKQRASPYLDRPAPREEIYEMRINQRRERPHQNWHDTNVEQRGFGTRSERPERYDRIERVDRPELVDRIERVDRSERLDRTERDDRAEQDRREHREHREHSRGLDAIATGLGIAGVALGYAAVKSSGREELRYREEREERKRKEEREEARRLVDRDQHDPIDTYNRVSTEPKLRDENGLPRGLKSPKYSSRDRLDDLKDRFEESRDFNRREKREQRSLRSDQTSEKDRRDERNSHTSRSTSGSSSSEGSIRHSRRKPSQKTLSPNSAVSFNPNNTTDLKVLKQALGSKESASKAVSSRASQRQPKEPGPRDNTEIRVTVDRKTPPPTETKHARVVSPPREKPEEKPVKGILRQPRDKFPEDPAPIREGVAPLKDAKIDGIPPDARWTKINRRLVNPEALEAGKERFEARENFVIVLRVLTKEEVQAYADLTQKIRASYEEFDGSETSQTRSTRRARHENRERKKDGSYDSRSHQDRELDSNSDSDLDEITVEEQGNSDNIRKKPVTHEAMPRRKSTFQEALMSGGLNDITRDSSRTGSVESMNPIDARVQSQYSGYSRGSPTATHMPSTSTSMRKENR